MIRGIPVLAVLLCLGACEGGTSSDSVPAAASMAPAAPSAVDFTTFTEKLLAIQSDAARPTPVMAAQFVFPDDDNPAAFAAVLPAT